MIEMIGPSVATNRPVGNPCAVDHWLRPLLGVFRCAYVKFIHNITIIVLQRKAYMSCGGIARVFRRELGAKFCVISARLCRSRLKSCRYLVL